MRHKLQPSRPVAALCAAVATFAFIAFAGAAPGRLGHIEAPLPHVAQNLAYRGVLKIVAFGSSSTEGIGATSRDAAYPARLRSDLADTLPEDRIEVVNAGIGGEDVDDMMKRLPGVIAQQPDLVIWQTGSNDPLRGVALPRFIAQTRAGIEAMQDAGIDVVLMEPQYCAKLQANAKAAGFREAVRALGAEMGVPVVRRFDLMRHWIGDGELTADQVLSKDGLHMADAGYAALAQSVTALILERSDAAQADAILTP